MVRDAAGRPYVLIGGQAVNYWAERYLSGEPELKGLQPFTSQDIDFQGNRDDVRRIARQLKSVPSFPARAGMTALAGIVPVQIGGQQTVIEVVHRVPGVPRLAGTPPIEARWEQTMIRVLDPVSLLACKLELAATVPQKNRRDAQHLKILVPCVRAFLRDLLQQVEVKRLPAKIWLKVASRVLKLTTSRRARKINAEFHVDWTAILPLAAIEQSADEKIQRFQKLQLRRGCNKPESSD